MKHENENNRHRDLERQSREFFSDGSFRWKKSKNDVWAELETRMETSRPTRTLFAGKRYLALAASLVILAGLVSFLRFYKVTVNVPAGDRRYVEFPGGSTVDINAKTTLTYYPYWWEISRIVKLEGEAYFEVEKGNRFQVKSPYGKVEVLGTSFNIFAREEASRVVCITGKVKVTSYASDEAILFPDTKAEINENGKIQLIKNIESAHEAAWRNKTFRFNAEPVSHVFAEIERQYGIKIKFDAEVSGLYTGNFSRTQNVENVLDYVCPALGLTYKKTSGNEYLIIPENE